jgi:FkbM family methyltransferase
MNSKELIYSAYNILLGRDPDPDGASFWQNRLQSGMPRDQFLNCISMSDEFQKNKPVWLDLDLWDKCKDLKAEIILDLSIGKFCAPATDTSVFRTILKQSGSYEPHVTKEIKEHLKPGNIFVDIGANLGYFTLIASRLVGTEGKVISFEPATETYNFCKKNIELNKLTNVELYKCGLWNEKKTLMISDSPQLGGNHISDKGDSIECIPLDSLDLTPNMIKMDIEGAEPYALQGMVKTLKRYHPAIVLEINRQCLRTHFKKDAEDIWKLLTDLGYEITVIPSKQKVGSVEQLNALCPKDELMDILAIHSSMREIVPMPSIAQVGTL